VSSRTLYLCAGLQSSGSTLISWCFLQRGDMDGILDARFDHLPRMPAALNRPLAWCKFTIACFRFSEVMDFFQAEGWEPRPLLVARDVRSVFNSLITKSYGRNGVTADDPPIRLRLSRYLEDWELFRARGWPILRFEDLADDPAAPLRRACEELGVPFDEAMLTWPKPSAQIADAGFGNETFLKTRGATLAQSVVPALLTVKTEHIPPLDLEWMEQKFAEMNRQMNYPEHIPSQAPADPARATPRFELTRRYARLQRRYRLSRSIRNVTEWAKGALGKRPVGAAPPAPPPAGP